MHLIFDPTIELIAGTHFDGPAATQPMQTTPKGVDDDGTAELIEYAGRGCYNSYHKPNPATAETADYIANVLRQKHYSVIEHASYSFYIEGVSRNWLAEATRHRHLSWSVQSGRYVDPIKAGLGCVVPPLFPRDRVDQFLAAHEQAIIDYAVTLDRLRASGVVGKKARETARAFLPGSIETRLVVSGNARAWMEFVSKRDHPAADAEMQKVAHLIWLELRDVLPEVFDRRDLWDGESWQAELNHDQ